jgi:hypothetical protein
MAWIRMPIAVLRRADDARTLARPCARVRPTAAAAALSDTIRLAPPRATPIDRRKSPMLERIALDCLVGKSRARFGAVLPVLLLGCASSPPLRPAALDPSNPNNPESPLIAGVVAPAPQPTKDMSPHEHDHQAKSSGMDMNMPSGPTPGTDGGTPTSSATDAGTAVYTCPMHPEVRQQGPGQCPKCGMTLVPAAPAAPMPSMNHAVMDGGM